ncbi:MAG: cytochrome d ubiquinol oxidase subunit II, partial [Alloprevotella sp.]
MITYQLLQQYWWLLVSLLGALVVFLMFVQGANTQIFSLGRTEEERALIVNSTGRKWEFTFTTLVTFGGAFFASFPLFYSTSFGGAYWVWMLILFSFVLQAVSYEFQSKLGNFLGKNTYRWCLVLNGVLGPVLLGTAVGTFFHGANFVVNKEVMTDQLAPAISQWTTAWHGLEAVANPWNVVLGLVVFFLSRVLGDLYMLNNIADETLTPRIRRQVLSDTVPFLILFLAFAAHLLTMDGWAVDANTGVVS